MPGPFDPYPKTDAVTAFAVIAVRANVDGSQTIIARTTMADASVVEHQLVPIASKPV